MESDHISGFIQISQMQKPHLSKKWGHDSRHKASVMIEDAGRELVT
jgi:hypothetical protein